VLVNRKSVLFTYFYLTGDVKSKAIEQILAQRVFSVRLIEMKGRKTRKRHPFGWMIELLSAFCGSNTKVCEG
jgi:hypothetical protein